MDPAELEMFLGVERLAALCVEGVDGSLVSVPARLVGSVDGRVQLQLADLGEIAEAVACRSPACVVADEFESYEGIRGVILQGELQSVASAGQQEPMVELEVSRSTGFSFAGTLPAHLARPAAESDER